MILQVCECSFEPHVSLVATHSTRRDAWRSLAPGPQSGKSTLCHLIPYALHLRCVGIVTREQVDPRPNVISPARKSCVLLWTASDSSIEHLGCATTDDTPRWCLSGAEMDELRQRPSRRVPLIVLSFSRGRAPVFGASSLLDSAADRSVRIRNGWLESQSFSHRTAGWCFPRPVASGRF
jgi:hypothetical protein